LNKSNKSIEKDLIYFYIMIEFLWGGFLSVNFWIMTFQIKYEWESLKDGINIGELWDSLIGFSQFYWEMFKVFGLKEPEIKISEVNKWSIVVDIFFLVNDYKDLFSNNPDILLSFIKNTNYVLYELIQTKICTLWWENLSSLWWELEKWASNNPISLLVSWELLKKAYKTIVNYNIKDKNLKLIWKNELIDIWDGEMLDKKIVKWIQKVVNTSKKYDIFFRPIINDSVDSITFWISWEQEVIDENNFWSFIWKWKEIMPKIKDGTICKFRWNITAMQSNRWETVTLHTKWWEGIFFGRAELLCCNVPTWKTTEDYKDFFWNSKDLVLTLRAIRPNLYKKPKFLIIDIEDKQLSIDILEENQNNS